LGKDMAKILQFKPRPKKPASTEKRALSGSGFETLIAQVLNEETAELVRSGKIQVRSAVEILESADAVRVRFALPGLSKDKIRIRVRNNVLKVMIGEISDADSEGVTQSLPIPAPVDPDRAFAYWEKDADVLVIDFPKTPDDDSDLGTEIPIA